MNWWSNESTTQIATSGRNNEWIDEKKIDGGGGGYLGELEKVNGWKK